MPRWPLAISILIAACGGKAVVDNAPGGGQAAALGGGGTGGTSGITTTAAVGGFDPTGTSSATSSTSTTTGAGAGSPEECLQETACENCCVGLFPGGLDVLWDAVTIECGCAESSPCKPLCEDNACAGMPYSFGCWECSLQLGGTNDEPSACAQAAEQTCLESPDCSPMWSCIQACS